MFGTPIKNIQGVWHKNPHRADACSAQNCNLTKLNYIQRCILAMNLLFMISSNTFKK